MWTKNAIKSVLSWVVIFVICLAGFWSIKEFLMTPTQVSGLSMYPNLDNKERVLAFKTASIKRGSVVVFKAEGVDPTQAANQVYVKRVIGLPGDTVTCSQGTIYVNNRPINQAYISKKQQTSGTGNWTFKSLAKKHSWQKNIDAIVVPKNSYFVLGDNRAISNDSRFFGFVPRDHIIGVVKAPWWANSSNEHRENINKEWKVFWENQVK